MATNDENDTLKCPGCGKPVDLTWKICPSCGTRVKKFRLCPGCKKELEGSWKSCPYCGVVIVETVGPSVNIKDSVVKELHQTQQTEIHEAKGANVGGNININVGSDANGSRSSGSLEYQYEQYVMAVLQSGGSLERARTQLDQRRSQLGLSLKQCREVEDYCLAAVNKNKSSSSKSKESASYRKLGNPPLRWVPSKPSGHKKIWMFVLRDENHTIELDHGYWSGKRDIIVDGVSLHSSSKFFDTGSVHHFEVSGVPCVLEIKSNLLGFEYNLYVDGEKIASPW